MKDYAKSIVEILLESKEHTSSNVLAKQIGVSSRTIKRYMKNSSEMLESYGCQLISDNKGYKVEIKDRQKHLVTTRLQNNQYNSNLENIEVDIILFLLSNEYAAIDDISEKIYCSRNTVAKKMLKIKDMLAKFDISLHNRAHYGFYIQGNEINIRNCLVKHLDIYSYYLKEKLKIVLNENILNVDDIKEYLIRALQQHSLVKSLQEVELFIKYLIVTVLRSGVSTRESLRFLESESVNVVYFQVTNEVLTQLENSYGYKFLSNDLLYLSIVLGGSDTIVDERKMIESTVKQSLIKIEEKFNYNFINIDNLLSSLTNHICSSFRRFSFGINIDNPMLYIIKSKYLQAYNYGVELASQLSCKFNINIDENDIGYIALHFLANMESQLLKEKYQVIVVCSGGLGTSTVLKIKLESNFPQIHIKSVVPQYMLEKEDLTGIDFIISTNPFENTTSKKVVYVKPLLTDEDKESINVLLSYVNSEEYLKKLFREDLFYSNLSFNNKEECLEFITNELINKNVIDKNLKNIIFQRERTAPTELGNLIVIPHCIIEDTTKIIICTLEKPIHWGTEQVQVIFLGCMNTKDREVRNMFPKIYELTKSKQKIEELINVKEFNKFMNILFTY
ncbi:transcriptional antiterminator [Clostridium polyendosporum]|uniref:Transcriptional antiterminator n=1 Tax=Clostridium polyendosporum TaxID=69208 RepID=A0A919S1N3_9CLOT|nr:PTS sugar transporter subunit IIA [Clostridium polyendosporum]GIM30605.1 transcriptional antiterminator [Clostridium polyendosporum]